MSSDYKPGDYKVQCRVVGRESLGVVRGVSEGGDMTYEITCPACPDSMAEHCAVCRDTGTISCMERCTAEEYLAAIVAAGGFEAITPLSSYTRTDGDEWGHGRDIRTTWGTKDGAPICEMWSQNENSNAPRETDARTYWRWVQP